MLAQLSFRIGVNDAEFFASAERAPPYADGLKQRERAVRSFDCPLTESSCTEAGCSRTRCVRQEREDNAFRHHQEEKARAARGGSRQSRHMKAAADALALARAIASVKL